MAQFDVCRNIGRSRAGFPYYAIVQSGEFENTARRLVVPLARNLAAYPTSAPAFTIEGQMVVADALLMFAIQRDQLGQSVASLADDASAALIINQIDRVISRAYG
jgi:hypothetical protein